MKSEQCKHPYLCVALEKTAATPAPQAPIARLMVANDGFVSWTHLLAPGLPEGMHDLYCEPEKIAPYLRAVETGTPLNHDEQAQLAFYAATIKHSYPSLHWDNQLEPVKEAWRKHAQKASSVPCCRTWLDTDGETHDPTCNVQNGKGDA